MRFARVAVVVLMMALGPVRLAGAQHVVTTGAPEAAPNTNQGNARPFRRNILDMSQDIAPWSLYIQALMALQNDSESNPTSYFQLAGIHGRPFISWDNIAGQNTFPTGYCTHNSILFPSWHRPYLALFEQALYGHVQNIAGQYTGNNSDIYRAAAQIWRMPYWDWATQPALPDVVKSPQLLIMTPRGYQSVSNPLAQYTFPFREPQQFPQDQDVPLSTDPATSRNPNADDNLSNDQLKANIYNVLTHAPDYASFATQATSGSSLEAIHGAVHMAIGGDMASLPYAAFDPCFWLHHTNVDRMFALFQASHPDLWIPSSGMANSYGTFTTAPQTTEFSNSPLTPFSQDSIGNQWNSDEVRSMATFAYSYPEIQDWLMTPNELQANVTAQINTLYGSVNPNTRRRDGSKRGPVKEWFINVAVHSQALNESFTICFFDGDVPTDRDWKTAKNFISLVSVFLPPPVRPPPGSESTYGEIPLKEILSKAHGLDTQNVDAVVGYLRDNLHWGIQKVNGEVVVDVSGVSGLQIEVSNEEVTLPSTCYDLPRYGTKTIYHEITYGKPGGVGGC